MNRLITARCAFILIAALALFSAAATATEDKSARWDFIKKHIEVKDKRVIERTHCQITINSPVGDEYSELSFYESKFSRLKKLKIILKDSQGKTIGEFKKKNLKKVCGFGASFQVFDDICYYRFEPTPQSYPFSIEYSYERHFQNKFFLPTIYLPTKLPITSVACTLVYPAGVNIRHKTYALPMEAIEINIGNKMALIWNGSDIAPLDFDTLSALDYDRAGEICLVANEFEYIKSRFFGASWKEIGKWYAGVLKTRYNWNSIKAQSCAPDLDLDLLKNTLDGVIGNYRYVSISIGVGGWRPRQFDDIIDTKYGDCKDFSMLLVNELRSKNIEIYPALILTRSSGTIDTAFPCFYFNHQISVAVTSDDTLWMDPTCRTCPLGVIPWQDQNNYALIITDTGGVLARTPTSIAEDNAIVRKTKIYVDQNLIVHSEIETKYTGQLGMRWRSSFEQMTNQELIQFGESMLSSKAASSEIIDISYQNLDKLYEPLYLTIKAKSIRPLRSVRNIAYLDPCVVEPGIWFTDSDYDRIRPIKLRYPRSVIDSVWLAVDSALTGAEFVLPMADTLKNNVGFWSISTNLSISGYSGQPVLISSYALESPVIEPKKFAQLKELVETVGSRDKRLVKIKLQ